MYGALRERDGQALTYTAPSRNTAGWLRLLQTVARANPRGPLFVITDNLSSHKSPPIVDWLARQAQYAPSRAHRSRCAWFAALLPASSARLAHHRLLVADRRCACAARPP